MSFWNRLFSYDLPCRRHRESTGHRLSDPAPDAASFATWAVRAAPQARLGRIGAPTPFVARDLPESLSPIGALSAKQVERIGITLG